MLLVVKLILPVLLLSQAVFSQNPCKHLACAKGEIGCPKLKKATFSFDCECSKKCVDFNIINVPIALRFNGTIASDRAGLALAKQGGPSCATNSCMNGGICYTSYAQSQAQVPAPIQNVYGVPAPAQPQPQAQSPIPICACQPQFSGARCEIYNSNAVTDGWNNLCRVYNDRNMNICQNGGQCVFISDGKVACVCPSTFAGQYCEQSVYIQCSGNLRNLCHRDNGNCNTDGSCVCKNGYSGPRCDQKPDLLTASDCSAVTCLNGGTCQKVTGSQVAFCVCPPAFTGSRCEQMVASSRPRCNFTIGLLNDGAFTARFIVLHYIDGIQQRLINSKNLPFIGNWDFITIPYYATNITVRLQKLGWTWADIKVDKVNPLAVQTRCTKCYKVWGAVTNSNWDSINC